MKNLDVASNTYKTPSKYGVESGDTNSDTPKFPKKSGKIPAHTSTNIPMKILIVFVVVSLVLVGLLRTYKNSKHGNKYNRPNFIQKQPSVW